MTVVLKERKNQVQVKGCGGGSPMMCDKHSAAGSVSQRACVFCGSRVVLYPIVDALHLIHGPVGCAAYTWDIRGALSSGPELHRMSFSTDLNETEIIYGGEKKLEQALHELIDLTHPKAAFVYTTCIVGIIGDDVDAVCKKVESVKKIPVIPVHSEGFKGTKKDGYRAACEAIFRLIGTSDQHDTISSSINILGDFNIAGETWMIKEYYARMGVRVISTITGDGRVDDIRQAHRAGLNVVQCSGSMMFLARMMEKKYGIPYTRVSYFGIEDTTQALFAVARHFKDPEVLEKTSCLVEEETARTGLILEGYRSRLKGKKATIYVGGAFKAFSLIKALRLLGMKTAVVGSQTGNPDDYQRLQDLCDEGTVIVDDSNPVELAHFSIEKDVDLFIGGVKERPLAYKLGIGFCDHNHSRRYALAGYEGMVNFAKEVYSSVMSPVWRFAPRRSQREVVHV